MPEDRTPRSHTLQDHIGGHLEQHIGNEKHARAKTKDCGGETQILIHGQRRETHIQTVKKVDHI